MQAPHVARLERAAYAKADYASSFNMRGELLKLCTSSGTMALLSRSSRVYSSSPSSIIPSLRIAFASQSSQRSYATQSSLGSSTTPTARRKAVTIANDDGRVRWGDLTTGERVARTTQTSFYSTVVIVGMIATVRFPPPPLSPETNL